MMRSIIMALLLLQVRSEGGNAARSLQSIPPMQIMATAFISIPFSTLMDEPTIAVVETTALDFIKEYLPKEETERVDITAVKVSQQVLDARSVDLLLLSIPIHTAKGLHVYIKVSGQWWPGDSGLGVYPLGKVVEETFSQHYDVFESKLDDSSSFSQPGYKSASLKADQPDDTRASSEDNSIIIIASVAVACAIVAAISVLLLYKRQRHSDRDIDLVRDQIKNMSASLPACSSGEFLSTSDGNPSHLDSPTEADIYSDNDKLDQGSVGSNLYGSKSSLRSKSPSKVSKRYGHNDESPDDVSAQTVSQYRFSCFISLHMILSFFSISTQTTMTDLDRDVEEPRSFEYSSFRSLSTIDEDMPVPTIDENGPAKSEEIDQRSSCCDCSSPRSSSFFEFKQFSAWGESRSI